MQTTRVPFDTMIDAFETILATTGIARDRVELCANIIAQSTFDGIESHGIRRLLPMVDAIQAGTIVGNASPELVQSFGAVEIWDGHFGIGPVNATHATERATALADEHGIGCAGLRYTTHWLRAGTYGWQAVASNKALICWTNTISNMPAWGTEEKSVGNNPLVIAVPHPDRPVVLDMAMSQYALGALNVAAHRGESLDIPGGYDAEGKLSHDPEAVLESGRILPAGFWKGSGLALVLDALGVFLTGGSSTADFDRIGEERGVTQVFIAFDPKHIHGEAIYEALVGNVTDALERATPADGVKSPRYPGKGTLARRSKNMALGVEVDTKLWQTILKRASTDNQSV